MLVCCVCGKVDDDSEEDEFATCSLQCREDLERLQPASQRPAHSRPRAVEEHPSEPGLPLPEELAAIFDGTPPKTDAA